MKPPPVLPDAADRRRAATCFDTNFVVVAGAGTGKTSLLVERVLNAVGSGAATIGELAAITFTEKAAGELRDRIARGLDRLRRDATGETAPALEHEAGRAFVHLRDELGLEPPAIARRALAALEDLDRARVQTIHGFCSQLLRSFPVEAGLDPDFAVDPGEAAASLREELWERFAQRELGPHATRSALWRRLLDELPLETVGELGRAMADFSIPDELLHEPFDDPRPLAVLREEASQLADRLDTFLSRARGLTPGASHFFEGLRATLAALGDEGLERARAVLRGNPAFEQRLEKSGYAPNTKLAGVTAEEFKRLQSESLTLLRRLLQVRDGTFATLVEAVSPFVLEFRETLLQRGLLTFDGLLALTRDLLRDHPEVRRAVKRRQRMLLIDELQDTDPVQYEIALFLAEPLDDAATDAFAARLEPGRLFAVGDAKQSIYRFRGADHAAYRRIVGRVLATGGETLRLTGNFRSVPGVLAPVNAMFDAADGRWRESPYQPAYEPIEAVRPAGDTHPAVEVWTVERHDGPAEERRTAEGRAIALEIERLHAARRCGYRHITILFRAMTNLSLYLRPLRERGIPFVVDGGRELLGRPEVAHLLAALRTLGRPWDETALLAFLRSPAGGVSDVELARYAAARGRWDWRTTDVEGFPRIARRFALLRGLAEEVRDLPVDAVVRRVVDRTGLLALGAAAYEGAQRVANLRRLTNAAADIAREGRLSLDEIVDALREGRTDESEIESSLVDEAAEAVRVTTIHRMKGLENDLIFVPDLARQGPFGRRGGIGASVARLPSGERVLALRAGPDQNAAGVWAEIEDARHETAEELRVLYVALTRARNRLVVVAGRGRSKSDWVASLEPWGYRLDPPLEDGVRLAGDTVLHRHVPLPPRERRETAPTPIRVRQAVARFEETAGRLRDAARPRFATPSGLEPDVAPDSRKAALSREAAKALGILVHRAVETGAASAGGPLMLDALCGVVAHETGVDRQRLSTEARELLSRFRSSELARLLARIEVLGREVPVLATDESGRTWRGSIDLLYRDERGEVVVADYKTDAENDDATLAERYGAQLRVYAESVQGALDLPTLPRRELWMIRSGKRLPLP